MEWWRGDMGSLKPRQIFLINIFCNNVTRSGLLQRKLVDNKNIANVYISARVGAREEEWRDRVSSHQRSNPPPSLNFSIAVNENATFSPLLMQICVCPLSFGPDYAKGDTQRCFTLFRAFAYRKLGIIPRLEMVAGIKNEAVMNNDKSLCVPG